MGFTDLGILEYFLTVSFLIFTFLTDLSGIYGQFVNERQDFCQGLYILNGELVPILLDCDNTTRQRFYT